MRQITDIGVKALRPKARRYERPIGGNLYIVVYPSGRKSYALRYRYGGRTRKLTLPGGLTLAEARKAASEALYSLGRGSDPATEKKEAGTLQSVCEEYFRRGGKNLRSRHERERALKKLVYPKLGAKPITQVQRKDIVSLLDKIADNNGVVAADRVLAYVRRVFNWHATRDDNFTSPIVAGMARAGKRSRDRVLTDDDPSRCQEPSPRYSSDGYAYSLRGSHSAA